MPPSYVAPYVKRGRTDAADAAAICEAVTRPTMRFVPIKTAEQQAVLMLHRTRDLLVRQRTMLVNALRSHLAELGIIAPQGIARVADLIAVLLGEDTTNVPALAREALRGLAAELEALDRRVKKIEVTIVTWHKDNEASRRLATIPGVGPITASAIAAARHAGVTVAHSLEALRTFRGIARRMQLKAEVQGIRIYDDFAQHPT